MRTLLVAPHADDESLFAAYLAQRYAAHVVVVFDEGRETELAQATAWLGCTYEQWHFDPARPDWAAIATRLTAQEGYELVLAPAVIGEQNGFPDPAQPPPPRWGVLQHDHIGHLATEAFGERVRAYCLYTRWHGRHEGREESFPEQPEHVARKLAALSCYRSQIADPATGPWFYSLLDMREWIA